MHGKNLNGISCVFIPVPASSNLFIFQYTKVYSSSWLGLGYTLIIGLALFLVAQSLAWFQTNGQFISTWVKDHPILVSGLMGIPVGASYIYGTTYIVEYFNGQLWPARIVAFATGIFSFYLLTLIFMKEGINIKTGTILMLASMIIILQVFWKYD